MCLCGNKIISNTNLNKLYKFFKKIVAELKIISKFALMKRQLHLSDKKNKYSQMKLMNTKNWWWLSNSMSGLTGLSVF